MLFLYNICDKVLLMVCPVFISKNSFCLLKKYHDKQNLQTLPPSKLFRFAFLPQFSLSFLPSHVTQIHRRRRFRRTTRDDFLPMTRLHLNSILNTVIINLHINFNIQYRCLYCFYISPSDICIILLFNYLMNICDNLMWGTSCLTNFL